MRNAFFLLFAWSVLFTTASLADSKDIAVKVKTTGENVIVDVTFAVPATRQEVWDVLTDFDHMSNFVSNLKESKVVHVSSGGMLTIFQRGSATYGPVSYSFESTREITLVPFHKIRTRLISGNMRKMEGTTHLIDEGGQTRVTHHTDSIPEVWFPLVVGQVFIEHEMREQFNEMRNEIIRRKRADLEERGLRKTREQ
jgi:carbon monoxide dehydrogenase subunit G